LGEKYGSAAIQFCRLEILKLDATQGSLECRAEHLAKSIHATLLPLSHWIKDSPNNDEAKHLELLEKITHQSLTLTSELQAREGTFKFPWAEYGTPFDPDLYAVDDSQADVVQRMDYETRKKQVIAFSLMPAVQRVLPKDDRELTYARGVVLLKEPYVDYHRW
jgi:hypothetical protein